MSTVGSYRSYLPVFPFRSYRNHRPTRDSYFALDGRHGIQLPTGGTHSGFPPASTHWLVDHPAPWRTQYVTSKLSVLIVDDHHDTAESLAFVIRTAGHDTRTAYTPSGAAQVVRSGFQPDAIVMDIGLPDIDGFTVAEELVKVIQPKPLLICITGFQNLGERARQEGFDMHFIKPVEPGIILEVLSAHAELLRRSGNKGGVGNGKPIAD